MNQVLFPKGFDAIGTLPQKLFGAESHSGPRRHAAAKPETNMPEPFSEAALTYRQCPGCLGVSVSIFTALSLSVCIHGYADNVCLCRQDKT